ncbi:MAG: glycoside hydrolase family 127 protein [Actinomycetota bacterium]
MSVVIPSPGALRPVTPRRARLRPLGMDEVRITGGFWETRQRVNATSTLGHCLGWMERLGWVRNFRAAGEGRTADGRTGREFSDSEIYKIAEAMSWEVARSGDTSWNGIVERLAGEVAAAQAPDGYLNTAFGGPGQRPRYSDLEWGHELYCYGFLIQAGVAQARTGGDGGLLELATRAADHVCHTFGRGGNDGLCGHPGIEMALVELARLTGQERYLDQAALFVDRRGRGRLADIEFGRAYYQDDVPVREAGVLRGHAVRALYLAAGAVDVAVETGDEALLESVVRQWDATVARRTYLTGGMGSHHSGESFGEDFVLPPDRAYSETCAGVASVMLSWRLLLATGDPKYADLAERTLFNVVATSPAEDGRAFFYANTLYQRRRGEPVDRNVISPRPATSQRVPWFAVACCPNNVARTLASLAAYVATADDGGLQIHQYADADIRTTLGDGRPIGVRMRTRYPEDGTVTVEVTDAPADEATISLRVPPWARGDATVAEPGAAPRSAGGAGTVAVTRRFAAGDAIHLKLPVAPRWTVADPRIDAVRDMAAVERGPLVLCAESVDLAGDGEVDAIRVDTSAPPADDAGSVVVPGALVQGDGSSGWPYVDAGERPVRRHRDAEIPLVPYHRWANRGPSTMRVWLPVTKSR